MLVMTKMLFDTFLNSNIFILEKKTFIETLVFVVRLSISLIKGKFYRIKTMVRNSLVEIFCFAECVYMK